MPGKTKTTKKTKNKETDKNLYNEDLTQGQAFLGWDRNLDFNEQKARLAELIRTTRKRRLKTMYCILYVQLVNGARISETLDACLLYAKNGNREQRVRARKRKDRYMRLVVIPAIVRRYPQVRPALLDMQKKYSDFLGVAKQFSRRYLKYNSHAQRYAFIGGATAGGMPAQAIAKVTGQKTLDMILHYTQRRAGEDGLRKLAN